jgi:hypothetical protein
MLLRLEWAHYASLMPISATLTLGGRRAIRTSVALPQSRRNMRFRVHTQHPLDSSIK